jgi:hypothetical protein
LAVSASLVPNFLEASTAKGLVLLCTKLNMLSGKFISYTFLHDGKKFYAFYFWDALDPLPNLKEKDVIK